MRKILAWLSDEDLEALRRASARSEVAAGGHPSLAFSEAVECVVEAARFQGELKRRYEIPEDESVEFHLSDGVIAEAEGE